MHQAVLVELYHIASIAMAKHQTTLLVSVGQNNAHCSLVAHIVLNHPIRAVKFRIVPLDHRTMEIIHVLFVRKVNGKTKTTN